MFYYWDIYARYDWNILHQVLIWPPHCSPGDENPGRKPADIIFKIDEKKHDRFVREGNDLVYT